jgi:AhpD family alkylhydroperoxidase
MGCYHDSEDLKKLRDMRKAAPKDFEAWLNLDNIVAREDGAIPVKYRQLMALVAACVTQCPYCLDVHAKAAKKAGASAAEVAEAAFIAAALRAGAGAAHGALLMKLYDQASA